tara:strand:- start:2215 stop:2568 length:354 start_codon:yes stop_codon:yes gene_type:complete
MINDDMLLLDPWQSSSYSSSIAPDIVRTSQNFGVREQSLGGGRVKTVLNVQRRFKSDDEIMFFEYLTRVVLNGCTSKFIDRYATESGVVQGTLRMLDSGSWDSSGKDHIFSCTVEVL